MAKNSIGLVSTLLGLMLLSCGGGRTALWVLPSDTEGNAHEGTGSEPEANRQPPLDGGPCLASAPCHQEKDTGCAALGSDPMGCAACARARVPGLSCVDGTCQQHKCTGPVSFRKIASYPHLFRDDFPVFLGADMNRDGRLDLLEFTESVGPPDPVIWLGQSDGTFVGSTSYATVGNFATPNLPGYAAVGDFNEDGLADLLVTELSDLSKVWVRPGMPGGGLGERPGVPAPRQLMADLDGDCHLDFVTTPNDGNGTTEIRVLRGRGNGSFASPRKFMIQDLLLPWALADWNGDGFLDILLEGTVLHILPGKGDGSFAEEQRCAVGTGLRSTVYADLNQDGKLDMLWVPSTTRLATLFGQGGCGFSPRTDYTFASGPGVFALGDLNGDGIPDLAVIEWEKSDRMPTLALLMGNAEGKFTRLPDLAIDPSGKAEQSPGPIGIRNLLIADVNSDGRADIVLTSTSGIGVYANTCE